MMLVCDVVQALNIIFLGDKSGKGTFFPEGVLGRINSGEGFDELASGVENFPIWPKKAPQVLLVAAICLRAHMQYAADVPAVSAVA